MTRLQQQYNLVPNQYAKEMKSVSLLPHLKSMATEVMEGLGKVRNGRRSRK